MQPSRWFLKNFERKSIKKKVLLFFEKPESPDGIFHAQAGKIIGIEVTSAIRTDHSAINHKDKNKVVIFLNKFGLHDPKGLLSRICLMKPIYVFVHFTTTEQKRAQFPL